MPFRTPLSVRHDLGEEWLLLEPLVFEGRDDYFVIRKGFATDFASIPRPVRWLIDTAGSNSEPGVLHDAVWRESKREDGVEPRVDPWDADGLFRRSLRESGATAITRALMWIAVRTAAIAKGRFGTEGPSTLTKVAQVLVMLLVAVVAIGLPTAVAVAGRVVYWLVEWVVAVPTYVFERSRGTRPNWPWPVRKPKLVGEAPAEAKAQAARLEAPPRELLLIVPKDGPGGHALAGMLSPDNDRVVPDEQLDTLPSETLATAY